MAKKQTFRVVREHHGDRPYLTGETREAVPAEVKHLVPHVLEPIAARRAKPVKRATPQAKAETAAPKNKAEGAAPANKTPATPAEQSTDPASGPASGKGAADKAAPPSGD